MKREHDTISAPLLDGPTVFQADAVAGLRELASGRVHELAPTKMTFVVGSDEGCDIVINDRYASARHCLLERRSPSRIVVRDVGSKNGVAVDGCLIEVGDLRPGSVLRIGRTELVAASARTLVESRTVDGLIGEHPKFLEAVELATLAGRAECSVLILGETGTGKELFARVVHESSCRIDRPFVALNCGALSTELLGSELFGHVRGAFTGASSDRSGVFVEATSGTLFLDEVGELPREQQPHLLRVLETQLVRPVGSSAERPIDVRFVAATNRVDLVNSDAMRADLYHRIATVVLELPPLRERREDIPLLVEAFIARSCDRPRAVSPETMTALVEYDWPGNIRELLYAVKRALALCGDELTLDKLLPDEPIRVTRSLERDKPPSESSASYGERVRDVLVGALEEHGSMRKAARALGLPRSTFADRLRRYKLKAG